MTVVCQGNMLLKLPIGNQSTKVEHDALLGDINQFTSSADENQ